MRRWSVTLDLAPDVESLVENLDRLRRHAEAVRDLSPTARDDLAGVLHLLVGGDGDSDGYGLLRRAFGSLGLDTPIVAAWGRDMEVELDGEPVILGLRAAPSAEGSPRPLPEHLDETCLRFALPGVEPEDNWTYADLIKKVRNKFASHVDRKPPRWLRELRYFPAGDSDVVTVLLLSIAETVLQATTTALFDAGIDVGVYELGDRYLNGIELNQAYVLGRPAVRLDVRAELRCETWASGRRRALVGGMFGAEPFVFGLEGDARLCMQFGAAGTSLSDLTIEFRSQDPSLPRMGRNEVCWCGSGRKFKHCHG